MTDPRTRAAQAYDRLDELHQAGVTLTWAERQAVLAQDHGEPTEEQRRRFASRTNCHGEKMRLGEVASLKVSP